MGSTKNEYIMTVFDPNLLLSYCTLTIMKGAKGKGRTETFKIIMLSKGYLILLLSVVTRKDRMFAL
jgi:hypothetical protein